MGVFFRNSRKWIGYALYCMVVTGALLYFLFPADILPVIMENALAKSNSQLRASIKGASITFPFGIKILQARFFLKQEPTALVEVRQALLRPQIFSLLKGKLESSLECTAYEGKIESRIQVPKNGVKGPVEVVARLKNVDIGEYMYLQNLLKRKISGKISGKITYKGAMSDPGGGIGDAHFIWTDGLVQLSEAIPFLDFDSVDFKKMDITIKLKKRSICLNRLRVDSSRFYGFFNGTIDLERDLSASRLELKGKIRPAAAFMRTISKNPAVRAFLTRHLKGGRISVVIFGSLRSPRIKFM
ncbi:MAG TPA: type II secretion system protein GspN [Deltaproteobacteria bacterium]|nr:type II secretion system protein GspN [Deltaproteobacteria bacterium]